MSSYATKTVLSNSNINNIERKSRRNNNQKGLNNNTKNHTTKEIVDEANITFSPMRYPATKKEDNKNKGTSQKQNRRSSPSKEWRTKERSPPTTTRKSSIMEETHSVKSTESTTEKKHCNPVPISQYFGDKKESSYEGNTLIAPPNSPPAPIVYPVIRLVTTAQSTYSNNNVTQNVPQETTYVLHPVSVPNNDQKQPLSEQHQQQIINNNNGYGHNELIQSLWRDLQQLKNSHQSLVSQSMYHDAMIRVLQHNNSTLKHTLDLMLGVNNQYQQQGYSS